MRLAIILILLILMPLSTAIDFTIQAPNQADINQEFTVIISSAETETHDIKIFIYKDTVSNIISEIKSEGSWKNPYYYLKEVFPTNKEFTIKVIEEPGERELCARLRQTGKSAYSQQCQAITISSQSTPTDNDGNNQDNQQPDPEPDNDELSQNTDSDDQPSSAPSTTPTAQVTNQPEPSNTAQDLSDINSPSSQEPIFLNPTSTQSTQPQTYTTSEGKKPIYILIGFTILCVIIIILLALRKL